MNGELFGRPWWRVVLGIAIILLSAVVFVLLQEYWDSPGRGEAGVAALVAVPGIFLLKKRSPREPADAGSQQANESA